MRADFLQRAFFAIPALMMLTACGDGPAGTVSISTIEVTPPTPTVVAGQTTQLAVVAKDQSGNFLNGREIIWSSESQAVATVSATGMVMGVTPGSAVIIASAEGKQGRVTLTVTPVPIASLTLSPDPVQVQVGLTARLTAVARDAAGNELAGRAVTLSTSNPSIAAVGADGAVTGMSMGTAVITAASEGKTTTVTVHVAPGPVRSVEVTPTPATVNVGSTVQLSAIARDASGAAVTGRTIAWSSSNNSIATVSASGVVAGVAAGEPVTITATVEGMAATAQVTVTPAPIVTLSISPNPVTVRVGVTTGITVIARDAAGNELGGRTVTLTSSNATIATVGANRTVTGVVTGTATLTATAEGRTATAIVNVTPGPVAAVEITPAAPSVRVRATIQLTAILRDASNAVVGGRGVSWASSDPSTATVTGTGVLTGVSEGTATITATSEGRSTSTTVTVLRMPVASVRFVTPISTPINTPFVVGDTTRVSAVAYDSLGRSLPDRTITYSTSDNTVATISSSGLLSGLAPGAITVNATSEGVTVGTPLTVLDVQVSFVVGPCLSVTVGRSCTSVAFVKFAGTTGERGSDLVPDHAPQNIMSSNPAVATMGERSYYMSYVMVPVTGVAPGTVTLTARYVGANGVVRTGTLEFNVQP